MADRETALRSTTVVFLEIKGLTALLRRVGDKPGRRRFSGTSTRSGSVSHPTAGKT